MRGGKVLRRGLSHGSGMGSPRPLLSPRFGLPKRDERSAHADYRWPLLFAWRCACACRCAHACMCSIHARARETCSHSHRATASPCQPATALPQTPPPQPQTPPPRQAGRHLQDGASRDASLDVVHLTAWPVDVKGADHNHLWAGRQGKGGAAAAAAAGSAAVAQF